jgi:hypothetical protein
MDAAPERTVVDLERALLGADTGFKKFRCAPRSMLAVDSLADNEFDFACAIQDDCRPSDHVDFASIEPDPTGLRHLGDDAELYLPVRTHTPNHANGIDCWSCETWPRF